MPPDEATRRNFTSAAAEAVFAKACQAIGLPAEGAELVRLGENAIFRLSSKPLVVRVARSAERLPIVHMELCVARWLDGAGVAVARPYDGVEQPMVVDSHPVSVWHLIDDGPQRPGLVDLALLLRQVHNLDDGPCQLPKLDPLSVSEQRIQTVTGLEDGDRSFLIEWCRELRDRFDRLHFALSPGFVHGDAHTGNLMGEPGRAILIDFEGAAIGPREWDLVAIAVSRSRFGLAEGAYQRFVNTYGFDVVTWEGFGVLRDMRELYMTAWLMQNLSQGPAIAAEVALRIESMRVGDTGREWHAF
jgi:aminoglycoside phosphotransferase (APT) family kinase protein